MFLVGDSSFLNNLFLVGEGGGPPGGNHSSCIHQLELNICFNEYNYHDSQQACLIVNGSCIYLLGLYICFHEYNYHDSLQACLIVKCACRESW